jgi:hypothetical protein
VQQHQNTLQKSPEFQTLMAPYSHHLTTKFQTLIAPSNKKNGSDLLCILANFGCLLSLLHHSIEVEAFFVNCTPRRGVKYATLKHAQQNQNTAQQNESKH